jgi:hypothetical protein
MRTCRSREARLHRCKVWLQGVRRPVHASRVRGCRMRRLRHATQQPTSRSSAEGKMASLGPPGIRAPAARSRQTSAGTSCVILESSSGPNTQSSPPESLQNFSGGHRVRIFGAAPVPHCAPWLFRTCKTISGCFVRISGMAGVLQVPHRGTRSTSDRSRESGRRKSLTVRARECEPLLPVARQRARRARGRGDPRPQEVASVDEARADPGPAQAVPRGARRRGRAAGDVEHHVARPCYLSAGRSR